MNAGTILRTIFLFASCLNTALVATDVAQFNNPTVDLIYKIVSVVVNAVMAGCAAYFNNDFTKEAAEGTGLTRQLKKQKKEGYIGEDFSEVVEDEQEHL